MSRVFEDVRRFLEKASFKLRVALGAKPKRPEFRQESTDLQALARKVKAMDYWKLCREVSGRAELLRLRALTWRERLTDHMLRVEREMVKLLPADERRQIVQKYGAIWKVEAVEAKGQNHGLFAWYKAEHEQCVREIDKYFELAKAQDQVLKLTEDELERRRESEPPEKL